MITGAEYIAQFLVRIGSRHVFALTGGACAFLIDAVARRDDLKVICVQNEQAAAMAADAVWRVGRRVGVTMATSGPGATNLITGIACSFFDSIPSLHITGQVNQYEGENLNGATIRQTGFQETKIVEMVRPITKYAVRVRSTDELREELAKAYSIATSGRMGPVLIDVPMDIQQAYMEPEFPNLAPATITSRDSANSTASALAQAFENSARPIVLWGGGVVMAGVEDQLLRWLSQSDVPFVASWAGLSGFDHNHSSFVGQIGVYGNRGANFVLQNADMVIVLGSRLDNRQRSGSAENFAKGAEIHVIDVDEEELRKYNPARYRTYHLNLADLPEVLSRVQAPHISDDWRSYVQNMKSEYFQKETSTTAASLNSLSPYDVVRKLATLVDEDAIIAADTGAAVCWLHQSFHVKHQCLFTAGGNSPMGYALCAAIGAKLESPERQVVSYNGDGGFQVNIQELQTVKYLNLDIAIVVMNNGCYGIIKQFQDSYLASRYTGSQDGYSAPDFGKIAAAYDIGYVKVRSLEDLTRDIFRGGPILIDVMINEKTLIEPKLEMGRPINDQFPYLSHKAYSSGNKFVQYPRPNQMLPEVS